MRGPGPSVTSMRRMSAMLSSLIRMHPRGRSLARRAEEGKVVRVRSSFAGGNETQNGTADRGAAQYGTPGGVRFAVQHLVPRDAHPARLDQRLVAVRLHLVIDRKAIGDRTARDAAARLLQRLEPAMQLGIGLFRCGGFEVIGGKRNQKCEWEE